MKAKLVKIDETAEGQRIDNYLINQLKGVPKARIYRAVRKGEVRVNKGRVKPEYRLVLDDEVRIPPLRVASPAEKQKPSASFAEQLEARILYEDADLLIIDKPSGMAVHGGTGINIGLIEALRSIRPKQKLLELAHRLDRDTSGCLLVAKKRRVLVELHQLLANRKVSKQYLALVKGHWPAGLTKVEAPLLKNRLQSGERMVVVSDDGKPAVTRFRPIKTFKTTTLIEAKPLTGRTHQIRVHAQHAGYPIVGDEKYGDAAFNRQMRALGVKRLFLHAAGLRFQLSSAPLIGLCALLEDDLKSALRVLASSLER